MTRSQLFLLILLAIAVSALAALAVAEEPNDPNCYTQTELETDVTANGATIAGAAYYDGVNSDATIIVQAAREILAFGFKDGCLIGMTGIDLTAAPKGSPA